MDPLHEETRCASGRFIDPLHAKIQRSPGRFRVGDKVRSPYAWPGIVGEVVEDHGNLGVGGRRIYGVRFRVDEWNEPIIEIPEDALEPGAK